MLGDVNAKFCSENTFLRYVMGSSSLGNFNNNDEKFTDFRAFQISSAEHCSSTAPATKSAEFRLAGNDH